ncbi:MAG: FadR/GntR family transcriptional regulator [Actinomycetota bacterium]
MSDGLTIGPISRETVSEQVRTQLLGSIVSGELAPGARVPSERDLSERFGVARTSIREAMQGLVSLGAVERRGNRVYVAERLPEVALDGDDDRKKFVQELFETRRVLELPIFQLAAERADDADKVRIREAANQFVPGLTIGEFRRLDRQFHTTIAAACGNALLIELYAKVLDRLFRSDEFDSLLSAEANRAAVDDIVVQSVDDHLAIADAICGGDVETAGACSEAHLSHVEQRMVERLV